MEQKSEKQANQPDQEALANIQTTWSLKKKKDCLMSKCLSQTVWKREIISNPNFKLQRTIVNSFFFSLTVTTVYTSYSWTDYVHVG